MKSKQSRKSGASFLFSSRKRKGQYMVLEEILLFSAGIAVFGGVLILTNNFLSEIEESSGSNQFGEISQQILNGVYTVEKLGGKSLVIIEIPRKIAGEGYFVVGSENKNEIMVYNHDGVLVQAPTDIRVSGTVDSSYGKVQISMDGPKVLLRGVTDY